MVFSQSNHRSIPETTLLCVTLPRPLKTFSYLLQVRWLEWLGSNLDLRSRDEKGRERQQKQKEGWGRREGVLEMFALFSLPLPMSPSWEEKAEGASRRACLSQEKRSPIVLTAVRAPCRGVWKLDSDGSVMSRTTSYSGCLLMHASCPLFELNP